MSMNLYLEEIEDPETEECTYELQNEEGNTVVNLSDIMDGNLWEVVDCDNYYYGNTSGVDDYECQVIFNTKGNIIISRILEHTYIEERNEFIVYVNGINNDDCYNETFKYDYEYFGLIDYFGNFILPPKYNKIEYIEEFDLYKVNNEKFYLDGKYIGSESNKDIDGYLIFEKNKKLGLLSKDGIILNAEYTLIDQPFDNGFIIISDGVKYGIHSIKSDKLSELNFDEISVSFYHEFKGEGYYIVRIGNQFGLANNQMELLFDNLLDGIDEDSFTNNTYINQEGKTINYTNFIALHKGKFWHAEFNDDISTTRICILTGFGDFPNGFDYLKTFNIDYHSEVKESTFIQVGFEIWNKRRRYKLLFTKKNKPVLVDQYESYTLGLNDVLLIPNIEGNRYGALVINNICQIGDSKNGIAIPFRYEKLQIILSKYQIITGIIGELNNIYDVIEPMQFSNIGQSSSYEGAMAILNEYYSSSK